MPVSLRGLPSLDLIRGFVAVGRRMSITLAAQDMCVTQSAVSRQVRELERRLQVKLFVRSFRSVGFTPDGEVLFRSANSALQQLQDVVGSMGLASNKRPVFLTTSIGVAGLWLLPRLSSFQREHPGIDLRISADNRVVDLRLDDIDLAIRYTQSASTNEGAVRLFGEAVAPVASPALNLRRLKSERDLKKITLIEFDAPMHPWLKWVDWLGSVDLDPSSAISSLHFNQYDQVIQAALDGRGVALGRLTLIRPHLEAGRLIVLDTESVRTEPTHGYWLLRGPGPLRLDVRKVAEWIEAEARLDAPPT